MTGSNGPDRPSSLNGHDGPAGSNGPSGPIGSSAAPESFGPAVTDAAARDGRRRARALAAMAAERAQAVERLAGHPAHFPALDYFLDLLCADPSPAAIEKRCGRPVAALACLQAPLEMLEALGLQPWRVGCGARQAELAAPAPLPALACPLVKAILGELSVRPELLEALWIVPLTCDWVTGLGAMAGELVGEIRNLKVLELPRVKESSRARRRWAEEIGGLWADLKRGLRPANPRRALAAAGAAWAEARSALARLAAARRTGRIPAPWWTALTSSIHLDRVERWTAAANLAASRFEAAAAPERPGVFLTGSPIAFPNLKAPLLIEAAGLEVLSDDLCTSGRLTPRRAPVFDPSEAGLVEALAASVHEGCLCPVFNENARRLGPIMEAMSMAPIKGIVIHLLKGCHPYEMDAVGLEAALRPRGIRLLRLETDYSPEDGRNLGTRLEAFRATL
jgi:benzoyl-CoA reductase/2-hydroxyglutaryl-CoA dehydratase subunit BcrC/BadD/HgdB